SSDGTVTVTVTQVNDTPSANMAQIDTYQYASVTFSPGTVTSPFQNAPGPLEERNEQTLTLTIATASAAGGVISFDGSQYTYTPPRNFHGIDWIGYTLSDNGITNGQPDPKISSGSIRVLVNEVNLPPVATTDSIATSEDVALSIDVRLLVSNDSAGEPG